MNPTVKTLAYTAAALVLMFVITRPDTAAGVFGGIWDTLASAAESIISFLTSIFQE